MDSSVYKLYLSNGVKENSDAEYIRNLKTIGEVHSQIQLTDD